MIRLKNMPHMLWIAGLALIAACSDGGGEERPGPQQTALSIVWTPEAPAAGQSVRFSLGGDVSNVRSVLWMFGGSRRRGRPCLCRCRRLHGESRRHTGRGFDERTVAIDLGE